MTHKINILTASALLAFVAGMTPRAGAQTFDKTHVSALTLAGNGTDVTHTLTLQAPALGAGYTLTFPNSSANGVLTNTAGVLSWVNLSNAILNPMTSPGDMIYGGLLGAATRLAATATANQILLSGASGAPSWSTATYPATAGTAGNYLRSDGTNFLSSSIQALDVPTLNQNTTGSAAKWTTARNLAGNSVDGSANVPFANKFIVQGTTDAGLTGAQFLGSLATGIVKNTNATGVLSIAVATDFPTLNQNTTGTANIAGGTVGAIPYQSAANTTTILAATGTANRVLLSGANAAPAWSTATYPATTTASSLLYSNGANVVAALGTANNGVLATNSSGVPSISIAPTLGVAGTSTGSLAFANTIGANLTTFQAGVSAPAVTYTLPASTPLTGQVLTLGTVVGAGPYTAPLTWVTPTTGTVTAVSVASANGFAGVSSGGATPALTLSTTITGMLKGNATAISAATSGTDYSAGTNGLATGILKSTTGTGALTIAVAGDFPTLNQNTTGTANIAGGTVGAIPYQSAANTTTVLAATATANQVMLSGANAAPSWSTATYPATSGTAGNYLRSNGTNFLSSAIQPADLSGAGVEYGPASTQNTLAAGATKLFDVAYAAAAGANATDAGATITADASGATNGTATGLTISTTGSGTGTATGLSITTSGGAAQPQIVLGGATSGIITTSMPEVYYEETGDTYGTARLHLQHRTGSNGALFETISNAGHPNTDLVDFGFKPGTKVQSNLRLEARSAELRGGGNSVAAIPEEFQMFFGTTTTPKYVFEVGEASTLLESGNFGIGYSAAVGTLAGTPLEKLDVHGSASTASNIILSNTGTSGADGLPGTLKFQGTRDGITSFVAGAQGSTNINYTLPISAPVTGQVLSSTAGGVMSWANSLTNPMTTTGDILYSSSNTGTPARLGIGTTAQFLGVAGGLPSWTSTLAAASAIGTTSTDGLVLTNTNAAANNAQQFSSRLRLTGQGWETTTPASQTVDWIMENQPVQGVANPSTNLVISSRINGGAFSNNATLTSGGQLLINGAAAVTNAVLSIKDGHIQSSITTVPTIAAGSGIGAGGAPTVSITHATDVAGLITVHTGTGAVTGQLAVVTVNKTYTAGTMIVVVVAGDQLTAVSDPWGNQVSANTFQVGIASNFVSNQTYNFYYHIIQTQ